MCLYNNNNTGHVKVYDWNGTVWTQVGKDIAGLDVNNYFGYRIALSSNGSRLAIGAVEGVINELNKGYVEMYEWDGFSWESIGDYR